MRDLLFALLLLRPRTLRQRVFPLDRGRSRPIIRKSSLERPAALKPLELPGPTGVRPRSMSLSGFAIFQWRRISISGHRLVAALHSAHMYAVSNGSRSRHIQSRHALPILTLVRPQAHRLRPRARLLLQHHHVPRTIPYLKAVPWLGLRAFQRPANFRLPANTHRRKQPPNIP